MSIRGVNKLISTSIFLRYLWSVFVLLMTIILIGATCLLVLDYFKYDVTLHQRDLHENSAFPAITICHHHPFSKEAYKLWDAGLVLSPSQFNAYMRKNALFYLNQKSDYAKYFYYFDSINIYYQNLNYNDSIVLGHKYTVVLYCLCRNDYQIDFENDCKQLESYVIKRLSHHQHFNCYTFEPKNISVSITTRFFSLIISLGRTEPDYANHEQAFLIDVFEQAKGLRAVVHEPGTLPDIEREGVHVEPGKMNEINFQPVHNRKLNTPRKPCIYPNESRKFTDLDREYNYTNPECILLERQNDIIKECKCIYILYPRPFIPNDTLPYCGRLYPKIDMDEFMKRLDCLNLHLKKPTTPEVERKCRPRCSYYTYESTVSVTKWRAKQWQLHWLRIQNMAQKVVNADPTTSEYIQGEKSWRSYLISDNLSNVDIDDSRKALDLEGDDFAYVVLKKKSAILKERKEKEVLSLTVLLSRIGGFCSLLIGLTVAVVVEFIEFIYLLIIRYSAKANHFNKKPSTNFIKNNFAMREKESSRVNDVHRWMPPDMTKREILL